MKPGIMVSILTAGVLATFFALRISADEPSPPVTLYIYSGILRSIDLQARTIMVQGSPSASQTFTVPTDAEIAVKDKPQGELRDLMIGDGIEVKYTEDDGVFVAHRAAVLGLKSP
jgi:hypothetical protein